MAFCIHARTPNWCKSVSASSVHLTLVQLTVMAINIWRILAFLIIFDIPLSKLLTGGVSRSFTYVTSKNDPGTTIYWISHNQSTNQTIFLCNPFGTSDCDPYRNEFRLLYSANITSNRSSFISVLTINNVTPFQDKSVWFCFVDFQKNGSESARYELNVVAAAEMPTCNNASLRRRNETNIEIKCVSQKIFPSGICSFYFSNNESKEHELEQGSISYIHEQNVTTGYYTTNCKYTVSAAMLGPGSHMFGVVMYPNITTIPEEMKIKSEKTGSIYLAYPKVVLDCEGKGYIKEDETSNCTCYDESNSFLPTKINWLKNMSIIFENGTLIFTAKRKGSFQCRISNLLNWTNQLDFHPNISYPPETVTLNATKQIFDFCNDTNVVISGICFASESNPEPSIDVNINNSIVEITSTLQKKEYMFNSTVTSPGIYNISCNANSMEYSKNSSSNTIVTIKGPPNIPKIFKNENEDDKKQSKNMLEISKGDTITCQAKGGFPILKNLSLTCGREAKYAINDDQVTLAFNVSNITSGTCKCVVWHESVCLQNTTTIQFQVVDFRNSLVTEKDFEKIYLGVGVAAGFFVVIIALMFIATNLRQRQLKKSSSGMADKLVANEDIYFINQEKSGIDMSIYPEYTNLVTTMSSAKEAPKNLKTKG